MDSVTLSSLSGVVLSLVFSYVPGIKGLYDGLEASQKALVMLVALAAVTAGVFVASCVGYDLGVACDKIGAVELLKVFVSALVANQGVFAITKKLA